MTLWIVEPASATDPAEVGGKAAALAELAAAGFAPPAFFVIPAGAIDGAEVAELEAALAKLGPGPFAVRSSAVGEDGAGLSHAGQFTSVLNVATGDVLAAVSVIVQNMVDPRSAGVAFSADPVSGRRDHIVISAVSGLGDRLVAGEVDGEDWVVGRDGPPVEAPEAPGVLSPVDVRAVADLALRAERHFGTPQDIEWALAGDKLHILQARPITTPLRPRPNPDGTPLIFDNSNIVESYPGLVSPLTYSFAVYIYARVYRAFVRLLGVSEGDIRSHAAVFDNMLGRIDGRVYYNLINWYRALALMPGFSLNSGYMETMMGISEPLPARVTAKLAPPAATFWQKLRDITRLGRVAVGLCWQGVVPRRAQRRFLARLNRALEDDPAPLLAAIAAQSRRPG